MQLYAGWFSFFVIEMFQHGRAQDGTVTVDELVFKAGADHLFFGNTVVDRCDGAYELDGAPGADECFESIIAEVL